MAPKENWLEALLFPNSEFPGVDPVLFPNNPPEVPPAFKELLLLLLLPKRPPAEGADVVVKDLFPNNPPPCETELLEPKLKPPEPVVLLLLLPVLLLLLPKANPVVAPVAGFEPKRPPEVPVVELLLLAAGPLLPPKENPVVPLPVAALLLLLLLLLPPPNKLVPVVFELLLAVLPKLKPLVVAGLAPNPDWDMEEEPGLAFPFAPKLKPPLGLLALRPKPDVVFVFVALLVLPPKEKPVLGLLWPREKPEPPEEVPPNILKSYILWKRNM